MLFKILIDTYRGLKASKDFKFTLQEFIDDLVGKYQDLKFVYEVKSVNYNTAFLDTNDYNTLIKCILTKCKIHNNKARPGIYQVLTNRINEINLENYNLFINYTVQHQDNENKDRVLKILKEKYESKKPSEIEVWKFKVSELETENKDMKATIEKLKAKVTDEDWKENYHDMLVKKDELEDEKEDLEDELKELKDEKEELETELKELKQKFETMKSVLKEPSKKPEVAEIEFDDEEEPRKVVDSDSEEDEEPTIKCKPKKHEKPKAPVDSEDEEPTIKCKPKKHEKPKAKVVAVSNPEYSDC